MNAVNLPGWLASSAALDDACPGALVPLGAGVVHDLLRKLALAERGDEFDRRLRILPGLHHVVPALGSWIGQELGLASDEVGDESHLIRMIGHDKEVER